MAHHTQLLADLYSKIWNILQGVNTIPWEKNNTNIIGSATSAKLFHFDASFLMSSHGVKFHCQGSFVIIQVKIPVARSRNYKLIDFVYFDS